MAHSVEDAKADSIHSPGFTEDDRDAEYGGREARQKLEKKLLRRIDLRMSILIVIYILNYVSCTCLSSKFFADVP